MSTTTAENVGILGMDVYFPSTYVSQAELEKMDGVSTGKYTVGLGQEALAFCGEQEDAVSMCMTVLRTVLDKYKVSARSIGRLDVGSESHVDRSKSIKTWLMTLLAEDGNPDVEGADNLNACYGGTAALYNAVNWVESRGWDGRLAVVVMADVALYREGPARPSGGCGAAALLVGPDAPLVLERGLSASHCEDLYDFFKPQGLYPAVDGRHSIQCYLRACDACYSRLCQKADRLLSHHSASSSCSSSGCHTAPESHHIGGSPHLPKPDSVSIPELAAAASSAGACVDGNPPADAEHLIASAAAQTPTDGDPCTDGTGIPSWNGGIDLPHSSRVLHRVRLGCDAAAAEAGLEPSAARGTRHDPGRGFGLRDVDFCVFHAPFNRIVRKAFARLCCRDIARAAEHGVRPPELAGFPPEVASLLEGRGGEDEKALESACMRAADCGYGAKVVPSTRLPRQCGNSYTASLYSGLASLVAARGAGLEGKRLLLYSYGSGAMASMFTVRGRRPSAEEAVGLDRMATLLNLDARLAAREEATLATFVQAMAMHARRWETADYEAEPLPGHSLRPGTYFLQRVGADFRRFYAWVPCEGSQAAGNV